MRQGSVDCESFRSLSIGVPFCFKLPAYPLRSSPSSVSSSIACPASLYLSLYPRIASVAIITALKEYTRRVIPALCEDSHRDVYVYPSTLSPSLSLSTAHSSPVTPLSPPRYRSTPLSGSSPLFVTAVSPLKHCVPSLSLSSFSPTCSFRRSQSTLLRPLVSSALRFSLRLAESSFLPDPPPCIFGRWIRRNGSTTPFVPELGRVRMRRLTSTGENRD